MWCWSDAAMWLWFIDLWYLNYDYFGSSFCCWWHWRGDADENVWAILWINYLPGNGENFNFTSIELNDFQLHLLPRSHLQISWMNFGWLNGVGGMLGVSCSCLMLHIAIINVFLNVSAKTSSERGCRQMQADPASYQKRLLELLENRFASSSRRIQPSQLLPLLIIMNIIPWIESHSRVLTISVNIFTSSSTLCLISEWIWRYLLVCHSAQKRNPSIEWDTWASIEMLSAGTAYPIPFHSMPPPAGGADICAIQD